MGDTLPVRGVKHIANLHRIPNRLIEPQRTLQRRALDLLHHQVIRPDMVQREMSGWFSVATARASRSKRSGSPC
jgi:hypothetical protein